MGRAEGRCSVLKETNMKEKRGKRGACHIKASTGGKGVQKRQAQTDTTGGVSLFSSVGSPERKVMHDGRPDGKNRTPDQLRSEGHMIQGKSSVKSQR